MWLCRASGLEHDEQVWLPKGGGLNELFRWPIHLQGLTVLPQRCFISSLRQIFIPCIRGNP